MRLLLTTLLCLTTTTVLAIEYQGAQAPPPAPNSCQGWCPKWTCCKLWRRSGMQGCGATRQCAGQPAATAAAATPTSTTNAATSTTSAAASSIVAPGFQTGVDGKLRANGKPFVIKGINWWGTEGSTRVFGGLKQRSMDGLLDFIQEQGFNSIRILVNHRAVMINGKIPASEYDEGRTPELVNLRYLDQIELMLRKAAERRLLVMINAHRTTPTAWPGEGMWHDASVSEADAIRSWKSLATQMCSHWNFFAADLVNEPRKASWGRGRPTDWDKAAERIGNAVLEACPRLLIMVQGVAGDPGAQGDGGVKQGYFWGENLYGTHTAPVRLRDQSKLVYSPHTYGPGTVRQQSYFPTCTGSDCHNDGFPLNMPDIWDRHFGFVAETTKQAVVIGEFGGVYTSYDRAWQDAFVDYLNLKGFGAFFFGLNPDSDDTGGLLHHDWRTEEHEKLRLLKRLTGTSVVSILGEEPPSPAPPSPPPPPPPAIPPPLFSDALLRMFKEKPPPPPPPRHRAPPPHHSTTHTSKVSHHAAPPPYPKAIILGGSSLVVGTGVGPDQQDDANTGPDVSPGGTTGMVLAFLVPIALVVFVVRNNPKLMERLSGKKKKGIMPAVRPRPRASDYDGVSAVEIAEPIEDAAAHKPRPTAWEGKKSRPEPKAEPPKAAERPAAKPKPRRGLGTSRPSQQQQQSPKLPRGPLRRSSSDEQPSSRPRKPRRALHQQPLRRRHLTGRSHPA